MQKVEVFVHDKACPDRIHKLDYAGQEEYESADESAESSES